MIREVAEVLKEFESDPAALAAEVVRLRTEVRRLALQEGIDRARKPPTI